MLYIVLAALAALIALWVFVPQFRELLDGLKTRAIGWVVFAAGAVGAVDPNLLSTALGLDERGKAVALLVIGGLVLIARELTKKPGKLVKK